jgi:drug/metabolite transporter (DMT)-like permease
MSLAAVRRSTAIGATAVLMWSTLALLTTWTGTVPPFQLTAMSFCVAFVIGLVWPAMQGRSIVDALRQSPAVWLLGVSGLFGYHFFVFTGLKLAPPVIASLLNYLWPLLIVLFSGMLPGERLRWWHLLGAGMGLGGAALVILGDASGAGIDPAYALGYAAALGAALTWSSYSVASRRYGHVPTDAVGGFCGATAVLAAIAHFATETTVPPEGWQWLAVLGLGLGPVGLSFFTWDHGVKHGDIRALGAFGYSAPLISTLLLVAFGQGALTWPVAGACLLIVGGACLAARDLFRSSAPPELAE